MPIIPEIQVQAQPGLQNECRMRHRETVSQKPIPVSVCVLCNQKENLKHIKDIVCRYRKFCAGRPGREEVVGEG